jgi:ankyrin repeat protein
MKNLSMDEIESAFKDEKCDINKLRELIKNGSIDLEKEKDGWTLLHLATAVRSKKRSIEIMELLIESGINVNAKTEHGLTPLHLSRLFPEKIKLLLDAGAEVNSQDNLGSSTLHLLVDEVTVFPEGTEDPIGACKALIAAGADVHLKNKDGKYPININGLKYKPNKEITELIAKEMRGDVLNSILSLKVLKANNYMIAVNEIIKRELLMRKIKESVTNDIEI